MEARTAWRITGWALLVWGIIAYNPYLFLAATVILILEHDSRS